MAYTHVVFRHPMKSTCVPGTMLLMEHAYTGSLDQVRAVARSDDVHTLPYGDQHIYAPNVSAFAESDEPNAMVFRTSFTVEEYPSVTPSILVLVAIAPIAVGDCVRVASPAARSQYTIPANVLSTIVPFVEQWKRKTACAELLTRHLASTLGLVHGVITSPSFKDAVWDASPAGIQTWTSGMEQQFYQSLQ